MSDLIARVGIDFERDGFDWIEAGTGQTYTQILQAIQTASLVAHYKHDSGLGSTTLTDYKNSYNGTTTGVEWLRASPMAGEYAAYYDGINDYTVLPSSFRSAINPLTFTVVAWVRVTDDSIWTDGLTHRVLDIVVNPGNFVRVQKGPADNTLYFNYRAGGATAVAISVGGLSSTDWMCLAFRCTSSGGTVATQVNIDGILKDTGSGSGTFTGAVTSALVGAGGTPASVWGGELADVALWNAWLTDSEVFALAQVPVPDTLGLDNMSSRLLSASIIAGNSDPYTLVAPIGEAAITLDNSDRAFSPGNSSSDYYNLADLGLPVQFDLQDGDSIDQTIFTGKVAALQLDRDILQVTARDLLGDYQDAEQLHVPILENVRADQAIRVITALVFQGQTARGRIAWKDSSSGPASDSTLTVDGTTYTFSAGTPSAANQIALGANEDETADHIARAINGEYASGAYHADTEPLARVAAEHQAGDGGTVTLAAGGALLRVIGNDRDGDQRQAQKLIPVCGVISQFTVTLGASVGSPSGDIYYQIRDDAGGEPGILLASGSFTPTPSAENTVTVSSQAGLLDEPCWIVLYAGDQTSGNYFTWRLTTTTYADGKAAWSFDDGATWTYSDTQLACSITTVAGQMVSLFCTIPGTYGNGIELGASTGSGSFWYSATELTGGTEGLDESLLDLDEGIQALPLVGDTWEIGYTNGLDALTDIVNSERGRLWVENGVLTFRNTAWWFRQAAETESVSLANYHTVFAPRMDEVNIANQVTVTWRERRELDEQTVARAPSEIRVRGKKNTGTSRKKPTRVFHAAGMKREFDFRKQTEDTGGLLPFTDSLTLPLSDSSGNRLGALDLVHPIKGTDYTLVDDAGIDYTGYTTQRIFIDMVRNGSSVVLHFRNTATGALTIQNLVIRGGGLATFEQQAITYTDWDSAASYGLKSPVEVALPFIESKPFAEAVAEHQLGKRSAPQWLITELPYDRVDNSLDGLFERAFGDVIEASDSHSGQTMRFSITGKQISTSGYRVNSIVFMVERVDVRQYVILDDSYPDGTYRLGM